jgi:SAM-dependent methyltransferase
MPEFDRTKWDAKYADPEFAARAPSAVLLSLEKFLPRQGRAIDVAGGAGRNAIWLAQRGLDVTIADVSVVGLALAEQRASEAGVPIHTLCTDLEEKPFPPGPWDLILSVRYLRRPLFKIYPQVLAPGGTLVVIQPTQTNLERHAKPPAEFLLDDGELPGLVFGLKIVHFEEGWLADGRHDAVVVARL